MYLCALFAYVWRIMVENYLAFIMVIALAAIVLDALIDRYPKMQRQLYRLFFVQMYFLFVIRYYYGPDIWNYVPHYEEIPSPAFLWNHPDEAQFEWGYDMFCSLMHAMGLSYWGMTAVITTLYFAALACTFYRLPQHKTFALASVLLLDYNLIYAENRQCLAVACFLFMVFCLQKKQYLIALILSAMVVLTHKSGFIPVGLTLMGVVLYHQRQSSMVYNLLILVLMAMLLLPVGKIAASAFAVLPLPESYIESMAHHVQLGRQFQTIALIYLAVLAWISMYNAKQRRSYTWIGIEVLMGLVIIVAFYQYFFLLNRVRSYYLPLIFFYLVNLAVEQKNEQTIPYSGIIRQAVATLFFLYCANTTWSYYRGAKQLHAPIARASTVFDLRHQSSEQIRDKQMKIALRFWKEDYMKSSQNKL